MRLLETNVGSRSVRGKDLLIYSVCIKNEYPDILMEFTNGKTALWACLELEHLNMLVYKIATMLRLSDPPKSIHVLTVDGSPHCVQLHYAVEEAKKISGSKIEVRHFVLSKGVVKEVSPLRVRKSRYLGKLD
ncbi:MAG: hypothetical protein ACUVXA_19940 [Candidatus Jordarchaeum sp.]|uniref:hypothetical protein n=1 Tax=Candidatus Jordarchaeum sp. TaxID=2823881 RepID=UPI00404A51E0